MKLRRLFFYTFKRYLRMPLFTALILLLPILTVICTVISSVDGNGDTDANGKAACIDYFIEESEDYTVHPLAHDFSESESMYFFHGCSSRDELISDVASGHAECGYVIPEKILDILSTGDTKESIEVFISPQSTQSAIVNESVYAAIFTELAPVLLDNYLRKHSAIEAEMKTVPEETVYELFDTIIHDGSTFSINIDAHNTETGSPPGKADRNVTSGMMETTLRGLFSVLILLAGFIGVLKYYDISESPVFAKFRFRIVNILVPMILFTIIAEICMLILGITPRSELPDIILYLTINTIFLLLLSYLIHSRSIFCAVMPVYLLGCLVFTPVFIDAGALLPLIRKISVFFTPHWYL